MKQGERGTMRPKTSAEVPIFPLFIIFFVWLGLHRFKTPKEIYLFVFLSPKK
jgi:hypothetical protein